jgi:hypothetical protein
MRFGSRCLVARLEVEGRVESLRVAEITASAFPLTRVPPLLGRPLQPVDEMPGAAPVVVLAYDVWQRQFLQDPAIIGAERARRGQRGVHARGGQKSRGRTCSHAPARQRARAGTLARDRRCGHRSGDVVPGRLGWSRVHLSRSFRGGARSCRGRCPRRGERSAACAPRRRPCAAGRCGSATSGISSPSTTSSHRSTY